MWGIKLQALKPNSNTFVFYLSIDIGFPYITIRHTPKIRDTNW